MGAGNGPAAVTSAQRAVAATLEDEACKLEVRECQLFWDEADMYSTIRPASHPVLMAFAAEKKADSESLRSKFSQSALYIRRTVGPVNVLHRSNFINPARKVDAINSGLDVKLSEAAEHKQHISGVAMYTAVHCRTTRLVLEHALQV